MLDACTKASEFLEEDKYMKLARDEQEALRLAQEMTRMAADAQA
jgi:hypothetical protein